MDDCIFCKIIAGTIPSMKIFEDEYTCVFMDISKDVDGHMIAVPKKHVKSLLDCDNETLIHLMNTVKIIGTHCIDRCGYDGINLLNASGESAGQSILHFHIHIVPRKRQDGINAWPLFTGGTISIEKEYERLKIR